MLEIKGLTVKRGDFSACLPELTIADGQCVALCGVSGSGKSTLMEAIGLLSLPMAVEHFVLENIELDELSEREKQALRISRIGIMPQVGGLLPYLTIRENLYLQITLALKQSVEPHYPQAPGTVSRIPNTTVALQEAQEQALRRRRELLGQMSTTPEQELYSKALQELDKVIDGGCCIDSGCDNKIVYAKAKSKINYFARSLSIVNKASSENVKRKFELLEKHIKTLKLTDHLDKKPEELSIGQRQRALFLRAIAHHPHLLLVDEPTSALDPENANNLFELIDEITHQERMSVLVVTHDLKAASRYKCYTYAQGSHKNYSVFKAAEPSQKQPQEISNTIPEDDINLMAQLAIDYPAASALACAFSQKDQSYQDNVVLECDEKGFHEIHPVAEGKDNTTEGTNIDSEVINQVHHLHYGFAHPQVRSLDLKSSQSSLGGLRYINERISYYSTPLERLQERTEYYQQRADSREDD